MHACAAAKNHSSSREQICGSVSQIFRDKPHTIPDSTQDAQTRAVSWVTCRHFRCVTSLLPRISLWGVLYARFTDTALFSLRMTGCGAAFDWQHEGRGEAELPNRTSFWPMTMVSLPHLFPLGGNRPCPTCSPLPKGRGCHL